MTKTELFEIILNGENSVVEFKNDAVETHRVARELVGFLNSFGGTLLLGVEDDGFEEEKELEEMKIPLAKYGDIYAL